MIIYGLKNDICSAFQINFKYKEEEKLLHMFFFFQKHGASESPWEIQNEIGRALRTMRLKFV